jgi:DNA topoisomerase IB
MSQVMTQNQDLSRSALDEPGFSRRRAGRGFRYLSPAGRRVTDPATLRRIKSLVIPPAWTGVWICPDPTGHIQAVGMDAAGRRQYRYHDSWRAERDQRKYDHMLEFGRALPRIRDAIDAGLAGRGLTRERVLSAALRLVDLGFFRAGGEEYEAQHGTFGLATIRREHVACGRDELTFEYQAKGGIRREQAVADERVCAVVRGLKKRRWGGPELLAYRASGGGHDVTAAELNEYLREISGAEFTIKDFRTWNATVLAAVGLAVSTHADSDPARQRAVARVTREVAGYLGNTPAVARTSYIDPRVVERYEAGDTIDRVLSELGASTEFGELATQGRAEAAVLRLLARATG